MNYNGREIPKKGKERKGRKVTRNHMVSSPPFSLFSSFFFLQCALFLCSPLSALSASIQSTFISSHTDKEEKTDCLFSIRVTAHVSALFSTHPPFPFFPFP
jgi:ABC-type sulfate transport system permease component